MSKFNLNRPAVPDEEINSHKDFGELVKKFKAESIQKARNDSSFLKNKKVTYSAIIAGATVICTITYFAVFKKNPPKQLADDKIITSQVAHTQNSAPNTKGAFIVPPIPKLNVPYQKYKVNAQQGAKLAHNQSKIFIPKNAFVNKQGQDIIGDVEIQYREFHNQADIIASGIPMVYDSAGIKRTFESAGMLDIKGFQNNEPVFIKPKNPITVELASSNSEKKFNQYVLDTVAGNWNYIKRDIVKETIGTKEARQTEGINETATINEIQKKLDAIPPKIETEKTSYTQKVNQLPKTIEPQKPVKQTEGRPQYGLDVDYKEFPELSAYKNAVFEIGAENKNYSSSMGDVTWNSASIAEGPKKGKNYLLTLKQGSRTEKLVVYPVLVGKDYDKAIASFEQKFSSYKTLLAKREADEQKLKAEFEAKQKAYLEEQKKLSEELVRERIKIRQQQEQQLASQFNSFSSQQRVMRTFQVSDFGIYNSDCANNMLAATTILEPNYKLNNAEIPANMVYLVCYNKNMVISILPNAFKYDPKDVYALFIVSGSKSFICNKEAFGATIAKNETAFQCTEISSSITDVGDLRKALGI